VPNVVEVVITARNAAHGVLKEVEAEGQSLKTSLVNTGLVGGAAVAAIGAISIKMAGDYQNATARLVTSAGEQQSNLNLVRQGMLKMASEVGFSATELAKGMYTVESAGFHGAAGLTVLKAAAQGAKDENADLAHVANAVTDILVDYHLKADQAANVTSQMVKAVSYGKTNFDNFSVSLANILPLASAVHLKFADVAGVEAEMTAHGMTAQRASQNIANAIRSLEGPTSKQVGAFMKAGASVEELNQHLSQQGLAGTLQWISQLAMQGHDKIGTTYAGALRELMGTATGMNVALMTTGENAKSTQEAIKGIAGASADAKGNVEGFSLIQKTLKFQLDAVGSAVTTLLIELGTQLLPVVTAVAKAFAEHASVLGDVAMVILPLVGAIGILAAIIKTVEIATKTWTFAQAAFNLVMDANPIILVGLAIVGLVAAFIVLWNKSADFRNFWKTLWKDIVDAAQAAWKWLDGNVLKPIEHGIQSLWDSLTKWWKSYGGEIEQLWHNLWSTVTDTLSVAWAFIRPLIQTNWAIILVVFKTAIGIIEPLWSAFWDNMIAIFKLAWTVMVAALQVTWTTIIDILKIVWDIIVGVFQVWLDLMTGHWSKAMHDIEDIGIQVWHSISDIFRAQWDFLKDLFRAGVSFIVNVFLNMVGIVIHGAANMLGWVPGVGGKLRAAAQQFDRFKDGVNNALNGITRHVAVNVTAQFLQQTQPGHVGRKGFASGGMFRGQGTGTSDSNLIWASDGEYIVNSSSSQKHRALLESINADRFASGGVVGLDLLARYRDNATVAAERAIMNNIGSLAAIGGGGGGGGGAARWASTILTALAMLGQSAGWLGTVESRMNRESGGDPMVVNKWDANWLAGTPSVSLMQVIGPTFRAYAGPFRNTGPFLYGVSVNPLANTYAGLNYALHRYGSLAALARPGGYDSGGWLPTGLSMAYNGTGQPERVLAPGQSHSASGGDAIKIELCGSTEAQAIFLQLIRKIVRTNGNGNVQVLFAGHA